MSIRLQSKVWDIDFPTHSQKLIALRIADHANDEGSNIWPSRDNVAKLAQCSRSTVIRTLKAFVSIGFLNVIHEGGKGPKDTAQYQINVEVLERLALGDWRLKTEGKAQDIALVDDKGVTVTPIAAKGVTETAKGVNTCSLRVSPIDTRTTNNHQLEPRASAREPLEGSQRSALKSKKSGGIRLTPDTYPDAWTAWLEHLASNDATATIAKAAKAKSEMTVPSLYPARAVA